MPNGTYGGVRGGLNSPYSIYELAYLPETTKTDAMTHGQGLISIRRQAEKYLGGMDIEVLENKEFLLVVYMQV